MRLEIRHWSSHHNMILYSVFYYCKKYERKLSIVINEKIAYSGAILYYDSKRIFFDYSDDVKFIDSPNNYDFYFKRFPILEFVKFFKRIIFFLFYGIRIIII